MRPKVVRKKITMSENQLIIELNQQPIELCKLLKVADLVGGGGEAKIVISEGYVFVNGEVEYQKRKKIYHQDVIEFNGNILQVIINEDLANEDLANEGLDNKNLTDDTNTSYQEVQTSVPDKAKAADKKPQTTNEPKKRRPISF